MNRIGGSVWVASYTPPNELHPAKFEKIRQVPAKKTEDASLRPDPQARMTSQIAIVRPPRFFQPGLNQVKANRCDKGEDTVLGFVRCVSFRFPGQRKWNSRAVSTRSSITRGKSFNSDSSLPWRRILALHLSMPIWPNAIANWHPKRACCSPTKSPDATIDLGALYLNEDTMTSNRALKADRPEALLRVDKLFQEALATAYRCGETLACALIPESIDACSHEQPRYLS